MKCLNRLEMQLYVDNAVSPETSNTIQDHIQHCPACLGLFNETTKEKQKLLELLTFTDEAINKTPIPEFAIPKRKPRKYTLQIIKIAASLALIIGLSFVFQKKEQPEIKTDDFPVFYFESLDNSDLNKKWHNKQMEIIITDEKGNIVETFISKK